MGTSLEAYAEDNAPHQGCHPKEQADRVNLTETRHRYDQVTAQLVQGFTRYCDLSTYEDRNLESGTVGIRTPDLRPSGQYDSLPEVSIACKIPANSHILYAAAFPTFQDIRLGCCMITAQGSGK
jgi:hypothetical protein